MRGMHAQAIRFCAALVVEKLDTDGNEVIIDLLEKGDTAILTEGSYFYLPSKYVSSLWPTSIEGPLYTALQGCRAQLYLVVACRKHCTLFTVVTAAANLTAAPLQTLAEDSTDDSVEVIEPEAKRARVESNLLASSSSAKAGDAAWVAPFSLLRVQGIPEYANR